MHPRVIVVIPARMAASRFPDKPLVSIAGLPMIEHVRRRALRARGVDEVMVATCDQVIADVVRQAGGRAVMTADTHERASGRVAEATEAITGADTVVAVVQGDEPLLLPEQVEAMVAPFAADAGVRCVSVLSPLESDEDYRNPNIVKAACNVRGEVMYFSRAPIPYFQRMGPCPVYRETGLRAFRADFLQQYAAFPETPFERVESIDLMRVVEHGHRITAVITTTPTYGVDRAEDVAIIERLLQEDRRQGTLHREICAS